MAADSASVDIVMDSPFPGSWMLHADDRNAESNAGILAFWTWLTEVSDYASKLFKTSNNINVLTLGYIRHNVRALVVF